MLQQTLPGTTTLPIYHLSLDWQSFLAENPVPDVFERTMWRWPPERIRAMQNDRFLKLIAAAWKNPFYERRWRSVGLEPGDIRSIDDIVKLPIFTSEDIKDDQAANPPFGVIHTEGMAGLGSEPRKLQTSGGTTGM